MSKRLKSSTRADKAHSARGGVAASDRRFVILSSEVWSSSPVFFPPRGARLPHKHTAYVVAARAASAVGISRGPLAKHGRHVRRYRHYKSYRMHVPVLQPPRDPQSTATQRSNNAYRVDAAVNFGKQPPQDDVACTLAQATFHPSARVYAMMTNKSQIMMRSKN